MALDAELINNLNLLLLLGAFQIGVVNHMMLLKSCHLLRILYKKPYKLTARCNCDIASVLC